MSVTVNNVTAASRDDWNTFAAAHPDTCHYHGYDWRQIFTDYFHKPTYYLMATRQQQVVGILPLVRQKSLLFGDYLVSLPFLNYGGILAVDDEATLALANAAGDLGRELGVRHIEMRGYSPVDGLPAKTNKVAMRLALPASHEELSSALGAKLRSQIKRPLREKPQVQIGGSELLPQFYEVFSRNMRDLGTPVYAKAMFAAIMSQFPSETELVVVEVEGEPAAAGFLLHHARFTEVPWASSNRKYNRIGINMLLYWEMLKRSIARGSSAFDFGRSSKDAGTYRFKKQWGAKPIPLYWSYWLRSGQALPELNPENSKFDLAIKTWRKLPLGLTRLIGPYLARSLP